MAKTKKAKKPKAKRKAIPRMGTDTWNLPESEPDEPEADDPDEDPDVTDALAKRDAALTVAREMTEAMTTRAPTAGAVRELRLEKQHQPAAEERFVVSAQFVQEFLRYTQTHFVSYEHFPALVQHILLMRKVVER